MSLHDEISTALASGASYFTLRNGTYNETVPIVVDLRTINPSKPFRIYGNGSQIIADADMGALFTVKGLHKNFGLSDLKINGNNRVDICLSVEQITREESRIQSVTVFNCSDTGIRFTGCIGITVDGVSSEGADRGIFIDGCGAGLFAHIKAMKCVSEGIVICNDSSIAPNARPTLRDIRAEDCKRLLWVKNDGTNFRPLVISGGYFEPVAPAPATSDSITIESNRVILENCGLNHDNMNGFAMVALESTANRCEIRNATGWPKLIVRDDGQWNQVEEPSATDLV